MPRCAAGAPGVAARQVTVISSATARLKRLRIGGDPAALTAALRLLTGE